MVLVVHADSWVRAVVRQGLLEGDYAVVEASNGASSLRAIERSRPSVIVVGGPLAEMCYSDFVQAVQTDFVSESIGIVELVDQRLLAYFQNRLG